MTPKEKANNLCVNFLMKPHTEELYYGINKELAKQCALIAIREVIDYSKAHGFIGLTDYYLEVEQEIEKL